MRLGQGFLRLSMDRMDPMDQMDDMDRMGKHQSGYNPFSPQTRR